eukprot:32093_1
MPSVQNVDADLFDQKFGNTEIQSGFATLLYKLTAIDIAINYRGNPMVLKSVPCNCMTTIADLKARIDLPIQYQILKCNNQILRDDVSLQTLILANSSSPLALELKPITIKVKTARSPSFIEIVVAPDDTVQIVKKKIDDTQTFNAKARRLIFGDQELENDKHISHYKIKDGDKLYVNCSYDSIFMFFRSKKKKLCCFDMKSYDQVKDIKEEWMTKLGSKYFAPQQPLSIQIGNKTLMDEDLVYYHDLSTFHVNIDRNFTVYVSGLRLFLSKESTAIIPMIRTRHPIYCTQHWKVSGIKEQLYRDKKIDIKLQVLTFDGEELHDDDCLEYCGIKHESEISLELRETTPAISLVVHDQGRRSVCYAYAIATVLRSAEKRIIGRNPPEHDVIANQLICRYGDDGASETNVLRKECPRRQLRWNKVTTEYATATLKQKHVLLGGFYLDVRQWKRFCAFFKDEATRSHIIRSNHIGRLDGSKLEGHSVAIYEDGGDYWKIKNSWGSQWGNEGFCKIGKSAIEKFEIYHVYYFQEDLTKEDWLNYKKYAMKAA